MVAVVLQSMGDGRLEEWVVYRCTLPRIPVFDVFAHGDRDFLVSGNVRKRRYYSCCCGVCDVVVPYVSVSSFCVILWGDLV